MCEKFPLHYIYKHIKCTSNKINIYKFKVCTFIQALLYNCISNLVQIIKLTVPAI